MKNKKIILLSALVFLSGMFVSNSEKAMAQSCGDGGTCKFGGSAVDCGAGFDKIGFDETKECLPTAVDPRSACCKPKAGTPTAGGLIKFENPLDFDTVEGLLSAVMTGFQGIVVLFTMFFFIWGAMGYIMSAGDEEKIKGAKKGMTAALIGMALGIAAPSLLKTIGIILGWGDSKMCSSITDPAALANCQATFAAAPTTAVIGLNIVNFLLGIVGVLGLIMMIIGGIMYFGAGADEKSVETAKKIVKYAIIGIALALGAMVIIKQVAVLLTAS